MKLAFWRRRRPGEPLDCRETAQLMQEFLDGRTDPETARLVAEHLEACAKCGPEAETMRRVIDALHALAPELPADVEARLRHFAEGIPGADAT